jgi:hypothetical protein
MCYYEVYVCLDMSCMYVFNDLKKLSGNRLLLGVSMSYYDVYVL